MSQEPLQKFGFRDSNYERPNQSWVCGHLCDGTPCQLGPTVSGKCEGAAPCTPTKEGDRFVCNRLAVHGGPCDEGPLPNGACSQPDETCQPARSLFARRKRITLLATAAALSVCFLIFGGDRPSASMSPGPLSLQHGTIERNCGACHQAAVGDKHWAGAALSDRDVLADSKLCLKCHEELSQETAFHAHTADTGILAARTKRVKKRTHSGERPLLLRLAGGASDLSHFESGQIACAVCHHEHRGALFDQKTMSDRQCQVCHSAQFESFDNGHPGLEQYAYQKRTGIAFDHARHYGEYFAEDAFKRLMPNGKAPDSCTSCHEMTAADGSYLTKSYEIACASCHDPDVLDEGLPGVALLALPNLSRDELTNPELGDKAWTTDEAAVWTNTGVRITSDGTAVLLRLLLLADEKSAKLLQDIDAAGGRVDAGFAADHKELTQEYLAAVKQTVAGVVAGGPQELDRRLEKSLKSFLSPAEIGRLISRGTGQQSLYRALVQANAWWFPPAEGEPGAKPEARAALEQELAPRGRGGWTLTKDDPVIRYRHSGHADPVLTAWFELLAKLPEDVGGPEAMELWKVLGEPTGAGTLRAGPVANGRCLSCHSVDGALDGQSPRIHWIGRRPEPGKRSFTRYSHEPHVKVLDHDQACSHCHEFDMSLPADAPFFPAAWFERDSATGLWKPETNPSHPYSSGFVPLSKSSCIKCHNNTQSVQDNCLTCHNYHVRDR